MTLSGCDKENPASSSPDPEAAFNWSGDVIAPATIIFENISTNADQFYWNFGDGTTSAEKSPQHFYLEPISCTVILKATQSSTGESHLVGQTLTIEGSPPEVDFKWSGETVSPTVIQFSNLSTNADAFLWEFGDGDTSNSLNPIHVFEKGGDYQVKLTGTNSITHRSRSLVRTISVAWGDPVADFDWSGETIINSTITLNDLSINANQTSWKVANSWMDTDMKVQLTYDRPGNYPISLAVRNSWTAKSDTITKILAITPPNVSLVRFKVIELPFTDQMGNPWDLGNGPDVWLVLFDPSGDFHFITNTVKADILPEQIPLDWGDIPGFNFPFENWSKQYYIEILEMDLFGSNTRLIGRIFFGINSLKLEQGYNDEYIVEEGGSKIEFGFEWR